VIASVAGEVAVRRPGRVVLETAGGVGYALAVSAETLRQVPAVLGGGGPRDLVAALAAGDVARLTAVPGIGKRTAERIVVELREKVVPALGDADADAAPGGAGAAAIDPDDPRRLARDGLVELGFAPPEADRLLAAAAGETPEDLLASALRAARR
jgi:Holliday junction DNA helicase RuvA